MIRMTSVWYQLVHFALCPCVLVAIAESATCYTSAETLAVRNSENIVVMIDEMDPGGREYITQVMSPTAVPLPLSTGAGDDSFLDGFAEGSLPPSVFEGNFDVAGGSLEAQYAFGMPGGTPPRVLHPEKTGKVMMTTTTRSHRRGSKAEHQAHRLAEAATKAEEMIQTPSRC